MIQLFIADDQTLFRDLLKRLISESEDFSVIGEASNSEEVYKYIGNQEPDMLLLDIRMPGTNGIEVLKEIKKTYPKIKVVMLTSFEDYITIKEALDFGADGYVTKDIHENLLLKILSCIANNYFVMDQSMHQMFYKHYKNTKEVFYNHEGIQLNTSDIAIIKMIAEGKTNKEIGIILNYTEGTIKNKVSSILSRTDLKDRTQLILFALKNSII